MANDSRCSPPRAQPPAGAWTRIAAAAALALALAQTAAADQRVDFGELLRLSETYRHVRYDTPDQVRSACAGGYSSLEVVDLPATKNRYLLGTRGGVQEIVVRGTVNVTNALYDAEVQLRWDADLGMAVHRGFDAMARVLHDDVGPRLDGSRDVVLFGHSLGAAEAVLLGLMLQRDGFTVRRIYASGQPKVTDAEGAEKCAPLPVLRVSCELDPVPFLPPAFVSPQRPYRHFGREIILLDGPWYAEAGERESDEARAGAVWDLIRQHGARAELREHMIGSYLARLEGKEETAREAPYEHRLRYLEGAADR